jgi:hypothetical protein
VRQLVAGFSGHGLTKGSCVCVVSFNDVCSSAMRRETTRIELTDRHRYTTPVFILVSSEQEAASLEQILAIPHMNLFTIFESPRPSM